MSQKTIYIVIVAIILVIAAYAVYLSQKPATENLPNTNNNSAQFQGTNNIPGGGGQNVIDDRVGGGGPFQTPDDRRRGADKPEY